MTLYHASLLAWDPGEVIASGGWGRRIRAYNGRHQFHGREAVLEAARLRVDPSLPSRMTSAYAFSDLGYTQTFAQDIANRERIAVVVVYEVIPPPNAQTAELPMEYINGWRQLAPGADVDAWAEGYWRHAPYRGPVAETLVSNGLQVVRFVAEFLPPGIV